MNAHRLKIELSDISSVSALFDTLTWRFVRSRVSRGTNKQNIILIITKNKRKMTKADIVASIAEQTGVDKAVVLTVVESFMATVKANIIKGEEVFLRGFGSFIIKKRAQKVARNISKNTTLVIPEHNIPAFKPAKSFMESMK